MKVPPFRSAPAKFARDYMTQEGAHALAGMIRDAWAKAGHDVPVIVVQTMTRCRNGDGAVYTVAMPTLRNGLPR